MFFFVHLADYIFSSLSSNLFSFLLFFFLTFFFLFISSFHLRLLSAEPKEWHRDIRLWDLYGWENEGCGNLRDIFLRCGWNMGLFCANLYTSFLTLYL
jgi:hypothetical protein